MASEGMLAVHSTAPRKRSLLLLATLQLARSLSPARPPSALPRLRGPFRLAPRASAALCALTSLHSTRAHPKEQGQLEHGRRTARRRRRIQTNPPAPTSVRPEPPEPCASALAPLLAGELCADNARASARSAAHAHKAGASRRRATFSSSSTLPLVAQLDMARRRPSRGERDSSPSAAAQPPPASRRASRASSAAAAPASSSAAEEHSPAPPPPAASPSTAQPVHPPLISSSLGPATTAAALGVGLGRAPRQGQVRRSSRRASLDPYPSSAGEAQRQESPETVRRASRIERVREEEVVEEPARVEREAAAVGRTAVEGERCVPFLSSPSLLHVLTRLPAELSNSSCCNSQKSAPRPASARTRSGGCVRSPCLCATACTC